MANHVIRYGPTSMYVWDKFTIVVAQLDGAAYVLDTESKAVHAVFDTTDEAIAYLRNYKEVQNG